MRSVSSFPHESTGRSILLILLFHVCCMRTWYIVANPDNAVAGKSIRVALDGKNALIRVRNSHHHGHCCIMCRSSEDIGDRSAASFPDVTQMIIDQVALQLGDLQVKYQDLRTDFDTYKEQHRSDLETLEQRLRDDYAQDMGGMELWMRQEHGRAIQELKQQHRISLLAQEARMRQEHEAGILLLRTELLEHVNRHAQAVEDLSGQVQESMTSWTSVVDAALQASHRSGSGSGREGGMASTDSAVRAMRGLRPGSKS